MMQGSGMDAFPDSWNAVINTNHPLVSEKLLRMRSDEKKETFAGYLVDLARLNQGMLKGSELTTFINNSIRFLEEQ